MTNGPDAASSVWAEQRLWSAAANRLKASLVRWRVVALALTILGAILIAASVVAADLSSLAGRALGIAGAAALALVPVVRAKKLSRERVRDWTRARSVSEAFKTSTSPAPGTTRTESAIGCCSTGATTR